jgi:transcription-repair coupling factor (superfamily II helicase)
MALLINQAAAALGGRWIVLCPDEDRALSLAADLQTLDAGETTRPLPFLLGDASPYGSVSPSLRARLGRLSALAALRSDDPRPWIAVTTPLAASWSVIPKVEYDPLVVHLNKGTFAGGRESLVEKLTACGYLRVDPVEDPGTFALRGEIVDVYPVGQPRPVRVEFFDDEIERVRGFDPSTQRAHADELDSIEVAPAREMILSASHLPRLRERLKAHADDRGISRAVRDPVLQAATEGRYPDHAETWAPFAYEEPETLVDHAGPDPHVVWWDPIETQRNSDEQLRALEAEENDAVSGGRIVPPARRLFQWGGVAETRLQATTRLQFDQVRLVGSDETLVEETEEGEEAPQPAAKRVHRIALKGQTDLVRAPTPEDRAARVEALLKNWKEEGYKVLAVGATRSGTDRLRQALEVRGIAHTLRTGPLSGGFRWPAEKLAVLTDRELTGGRKAVRKKLALDAATEDDPTGAARQWASLQEISEISPGDFVVHVEHGIGRYGGLTRLGVRGAESDFILIEYAENDRLYVPVYRLGAVQKYVGGEPTTALDRLGGKRFEREKGRLRDAVRKLAVDLVDLYARRRLQAGPRLQAHPEELADFESKFPYDETQDQLKVLQDVYSDLESGNLMDRLVCGDVGFGKTEVALRAAYVALAAGRQVAVLVPTTVLCLQHEETFRQRFKDYPFTIASVSGFKSRKEQAQAVEGAASGKVDILIGTHRLLSKDIAFKNLGLVVVDEEHRFGVEHKEKLKALKLSTHVLTLTATPIPRTLHMALSGLRDISLITTPPVDRLPIRTFVSRFDEEVIRRALLFECGRGGQAYVVHNRVQSIREFARRIQELVPGLRILVGHGQMADGDLEKVMVAFYRKEADILLCTTIIESGLDVPTANTIIIDRADAMGLAQLYQLRGRVGRSDRRAYAYLMVPESGRMSDDAKRRLEVIQRFVELGSGFSIASHDLEIRGGGNLLGAEQSGHIAAVGFELYTELLEEAIRDIKGKPLTLEEMHREPEIKTPYQAFLPEAYIPDVNQRLSLYRKLSASRTDEEVDRLEDELRDRFGRPPEPAENLLWIIRIKNVLKSYGIDSLTVGPSRLSLIPGKGTRIDPATVVAKIRQKDDGMQLTPDSKLVLDWSGGTPRDLRYRLETALDRLLPS